MSKKFLVLITVFLLLLLTVIPAFASIPTWYTAYGTIKSIDDDTITITVSGGKIASSGAFTKVNKGEELKVFADSSAEYIRCPNEDILRSELEEDYFVKIVGVFEDQGFTAISVTIK